MKISKSILNPSLSWSGSRHQSMPLRRKLHTNGSSKALQATNVFTTTTTTTTGKKRGCGLQNPEPSSPKVTCIGTVRIRTKKMRRRNLSEYNNSDTKNGGSLKGELGCCLFQCRREKQENNGKELNLEERREIMELRSRSSRRRHVLEDFEIKEEEARVSICAPPKNALLLMRCRSDPVKMAELTNRFGVEGRVDCEEDVDNEDNLWDLQECEEPQLESDGKQEHLGMEIEASDEQETEMKQKMSETEEGKGEEFVEIQSNSCSSEANGINPSENNQIQEENRASLDKEDAETEKEAFLECLTEDLQNTHKSEEQKEECLTEDSQNTHQREEQKEAILEEDSQNTHKREDVQESEASVLPDCLLLMMFEPKLSMEVSKETWVCSTDFIRFHPQTKKKMQRQQLKSSSAEKKDHDSEETKKRVSIDSKSDNNTAQFVLPQQPPPPAALLPPRSSCSLPAAAVPMAGMIEHNKVVNGAGYEPCVLKRCRSEPRKTAAKLAPESCFVTTRKLEPLSRASFQIGAA